MMHDVYTQAQL